MDIPSRKLKRPSMLRVAKSLLTCMAMAISLASSAYVRIYEGNFKDSKTFQLNGNSVSEDGNTITIDQPYKGVDVNIVGGLPKGATLVFRYRGLVPGEKDKVVAASAVAGTDYDRSGFRYTTGGQVGCVWNNIGTPNTGGQLQPWREDGDLYLSGELPERGYIAVMFGQNNGSSAAIYCRRETDEGFSDAYHNSESQTYLGSINDSQKGVYGITVGGCRQEPASSLMNAKGLQITGIALLVNESLDKAVFDSSKSLVVESDETVSSINARIAEGTRVLTLRVAPDVSITLDEPFAVDEVCFASEGDIALQSSSVPTDTELAKLDFHGVKGVVTRDWREYLSETGKYLTGEAQPAFRRTTLEDITENRTIRVDMGGAWLVNGPAVPFRIGETRDEDGRLASVTYLAQRIDGGYVKAVVLELTQVGADVWARAYGARNTTALASFGSNFTGTAASFAMSDSAKGYGLYALGADALRSLNFNFTKDANSEVWGEAKLGIDGFAAPAEAWNDVAGSNGASTQWLGCYNEGDAAVAAPCCSGVGVAISGSSGSWHNTETYSVAGESVLRGYIDENPNIREPKVTISNIPFDAYRVVVYCSTDTKNAKFGHVTVNGIDYTAVDGATTEGTAAWGASRVAEPSEGVNVIVSGVMAGREATVTGHRHGYDSDVRGCIAAIQIVKSDALGAVSCPGFAIGDKAEISVSGGCYAVTSKDGNPLTEEAFNFRLPSQAYEISISHDGLSATVRLSSPLAGRAVAIADEVRDLNDRSGMLVDASKVEVSAPPTSDAEKLGALPIKTFPGLFYQAAWGDDLGALVRGEKVKASEDSLYLGVVRQTGKNGFYMVNVTEE